MHKANKQTKKQTNITNIKQKKTETKNGKRKKCDKNEK